ncbi:hypothetical protein FIE12Z_12544 [Fusarium flagelliforme]|uniref:Uncharacterized protein n=1 Tax=Fusarium flagelliforme TaxID=2675880 RepID=A0A395M837_9HYPO|nr:hypothetical protein FIE12Z_12544 [Fusarium flagelliforme]
MKFHTVLAFFAAAVSATGPPTCKGSAPSYCKYTSNRDAVDCKKLFVKSYINVATCQLPAKTITSTRTNRPTKHITKTLAPPPRFTKVYTTVTKTGKPTTPPTITITATSTKIDTTVLTDKTTIVDLRTITKIEYNDVIDVKTITQTTTSTTMVPFNDDKFCTRKKRALAKRLPTSCSCFLTATKPAATKVATVTKNLPVVTHTVYKFGGPRKVIRLIVTIFRYKNGPTLTAPETTTTSTATITQTDRTLVTVVDAQVTITTVTEDSVESITVTEGKTATATATQHPCDNAGSFRPIKDFMSSPYVGFTYAKPVSGDNAVKECCQACYTIQDHLMHNPT